MDLRQSIMVGDIAVVVPERRSPERRSPERPERSERSERSERFEPRQRYERDREKVPSQNVRREPRITRSKTINVGSDSVRKKALQNSQKQNMLNAPAHKKVPQNYYMQPHYQQQQQQMRQAYPAIQRSKSVTTSSIGKTYSDRGREHEREHERERDRQHELSRRHSHVYRAPQVEDRRAVETPTVSAYQLQKQKMKHSFKFENGEVFTPRRELQAAKNPQEKINPYAYKDKSSASSIHSDLSDDEDEFDLSVGSINFQKRPAVSPIKAKPKAKEPVVKEKKKFGSFFKNIWKSKSLSDAEQPPKKLFIAEPKVEQKPATQPPEIKVSEPAPKKNPIDEIYDRLVVQWEKVTFIPPDELETIRSIPSSDRSSLINFYLPNLSSTSLSSNGNSTSFASAVRKDMMSTMNKKLRFSNEVLLTDTWAPEVYERSNDSFLDNFIEVGGSTSSGNDSSANTTTQKPEIKQEINEFKKNEMVVHEKSAKYTHIYC